MTAIGSTYTGSAPLVRVRGGLTTWARGAAAVLAVSFVAAAGTFFLNDIGRQYAEREARVTAVERLTVDARAAAWESVSSEPVGQAGRDPQSAVAAATRLRDAVSLLESGIVGFHLPAGLAAEEAQYATDLNAVAALVQGDAVAPARDATLRTEPRFQALRAGLRDERDAASANAARFRQISTLGTVAAILLAAGFAGVLSWRTERTRRHAADAAARQLRELAYFDALTNLPNRAQLMERLDAALAAARDSGQSLAVLFLDLDNFKTVNDTMGHAAGDDLIAFTAGRIRKAVRPTDTAARLGGDEFAIIVDAIGDLDHSTLVAERIMASMEQPFEVQGKLLSVRCSVGISVSERGEEAADELMRNADVAMYVAKARGKGRYEFYEPSMHPELVEARELLDDLEHALERGELVNYYQPIVELPTGRVVGAEALLRWNHPSRRIVPPAKFIPLAEQSGLIIPIGRWVLNESCRHAAMWRMRFPDRPPLAMHVNVSARQLDSESFIEDLADALRVFNTDPATFAIELTESIMLQDREESVRRIEQVRALGVKVAIDDFGTGYSSLSYLRQFPVDAIKIDRSFTEQLSPEGRNFEVTRSIVELGRSLQVDIVAEGIEYAEQVDAFRALGCTLGQGYYYARPMPADDFAHMLSRDLHQPLGRLLAYAA